MAAGYGVDLSHLERMLGVPVGSTSLKTRAEMTAEDWAKWREACAREDAILAANGGKYKGWVDCVRGIRIEFNGPATRSLSNAEIAGFRAQYAQDPTADTMWRILGEMSQMRAVDGEIVLAEMLQFYRNERLGLETGRYNSPLNVQALLSRLDNILNQISQDRALDAYSKQAESRRYEELQKLIKLITGA